MESLPLVSIIITCFNHALYVEEAVVSALEQTYKNIEIIIIDDASKDNSVDVLLKIKEKYPRISLVLNTENLGVCKSFNKAFGLSKGNFVVDLAADDFLLPTKIAKQINMFQTLSSEYGVVYSDLIHVDESSSRIPDLSSNKIFPEGDVFNKVLARHCIYASTMLVKREVYSDLGGYDETLAYEDFDFFVRTARKWKFSCIKEPLMAKRELSNSLGKQFFKNGNLLTSSTLKVCKKAKKLVLNRDEKKALKKRLYYEAFDAFRKGDWRMGICFLFC